MTSESNIEQSECYIAGGVVSLNRKASPHLVFTRAEGSQVFDADGRSFIDYHAAFAPNLLGHHHPEATAAFRSRGLGQWLVAHGQQCETEAGRTCRATLSNRAKRGARSDFEHQKRSFESRNPPFPRAGSRNDVVVRLGGYRGDLSGNTEGYSPAIVRILAK